MKSYTGVGSREAPESAMETMETLGATLAALGYVLRSGGALGADKAFEDGCLSVDNGQAEIFLPWSGYNDHTTKSHKGMCILPSHINFSLEDKAMKLAEEIHPAWDNCSPGAKKMHARNCFQVLGRFLDDKSKFLVCWAKTDNKGNVKGGTATAWNLATKHNIPCFNVGNPEHLARIQTFIESRA